MRTISLKKTWGINWYLVLTVLPVFPIVDVDNSGLGVFILLMVYLFDKYKKKQINSYSLNFYKLWYET